MRPSDLTERSAKKVPPVRKLPPPSQPGSRPRNERMVFFAAALILATGLAACQKRGKSPVKTGPVAEASAAALPAQRTWPSAGSCS